MDKGNFIAILDENDYLEKMRNILSDSSKYTQVSIGQNKQLNFIVNLEKHITDLLKDFKKCDVISETFYKILKPRGFRLGILYGLCKVRK